MKKAFIGETTNRAIIQKISERLEVLGIDPVFYILDEFDTETRIRALLDCDYYIEQTENIIGPNKDIFLCEHRIAELVPITIWNIDTINEEIAEWAVNNHKDINPPEEGEENEIETI